ncbi:MAG: tetratricopeptide repeat protein [Ardenticatenia bacterium]|nr:tetratricopeptide repeat protein [Ardenticatenia bacterium]
MRPSGGPRLRREDGVALAKWIALSAVSGAIGNAAYDAIKQFLAQRAVVTDGAIGSGYAGPGEAVPTQPTSALEALHRGEKLFHRKSYLDAIDLYSRAIELDPKYASAYLSRGIASERLGAYQRALKDYGPAIELDPKDAYAYHGRGVAYANLGSINALEGYSRAIELDPKYASAYRNRGSPMSAWGVSTRPGGLQPGDRTRSQVCLCLLQPG